MGKPSWFAVVLASAMAVGGCGSKNEGESKGSKDKTNQASKGASTKADAPTKKGAQKPTTPAATGPIAKINGVELARSEFDAKFAKMTKAFTTRNKDIPEGLAQRYKESILKQLIDKELLRQKIKAEGITVDAAALEKEFADYKKMFRTDENFERYLKSSKIDVKQIKANIEHNLAVTTLLEKSGSLAVSDEDIKAYYDKNAQRYEVKEQVRASHILLKVPKGDEAKSAEVKKKADGIHKEAIAKGADFAALAKKYSEGPTKARGGDLSFFTKGRMVPEFEKVAFTMKAGDVSAPVKTQFGWHIIKVTERKEGRKRPFDEVKASIGKLLKNKKNRQAKSDLLKGLKAGAKVETFLPKIKTVIKAGKAPAMMPLKVDPKKLLKKKPANQPTK